MIFRPVTRGALRIAQRAGLTALCAGLTLALSSCMERVDAELKLNTKVTTRPLNWKLAGSFGGEARLAVQSEDPWQQRFEPGGFKQVAGVCATGGEVWVCDLGISRIQVFDESGTFKRSYGQGVPLKDTLPSLERLWNDSGLKDGDPKNWDYQHGAPWKGSEGRLFQAADVQPLGPYLWMADWARTGTSYRFSRESGMRRFSMPDPAAGSLDDLGTPLRTDNNRFAWPTYISGSGSSMAVSEPWGNVIRIYDVRTNSETGQTDIATPLNLSHLLQARIGAKGRVQQVQYLAMRDNSSGAPAKFNNVQGVCVAFDKIIACDTDNARLQVFDGHPDDRFYWGKLLRIIPARDPAGFQRFMLPKDIDVAADGTVYVLDAARNEIAVLNSRFERIGAFGRGDLHTPWAIDLSDDGKSCYVSDTQGNKVLHYVLEAQSSGGGY